MQKFVVSRDDQVYEAVPDLTLTASGRLVCVFAEWQHHMDRRYSRIVLVRSEDRGRTWSEKYPLTEPTAGIPHLNCPSISRLRDGRLVALIDRIGVVKSEAAAHPERLENLMYVSEDEGLTWSDPVLTPAQGIVPDKLLELPSGRWIISAQIRNENNEGIQRLWYSDDQGSSWSDPVTVGYLEGRILSEVSILPLDDTTLVAFHRENSMLGLDCFKTISRDRGESWSEPIAFPLPGCHSPAAGLLRDGRVLITYRFFQGGRIGFGIGAQNLSAALTDRESVLAPTRNETHVRILPVDYDRSVEPDLGYSGWVQFDDGEVYVVNYIVDDAPKAQIRGYSLTVDDFVLPGSATSPWEMSLH